LFFVGMFEFNSKTGLHNSESSKGQIDQRKFSTVRKSLFSCTITRKKFWNDNYATFSAIEKVLTGHKKRSRGQYGVEACSKASAVAVASPSDIKTVIRSSLLHITFLNVVLCAVLCFWWWLTC